jgi:hypothetical protein
MGNSDRNPAAEPRSAARISPSDSAQESGAILLALGVEGIAAGMVDSGLQNGLSMPAGGSGGLGTSGRATILFVAGAADICCEAGWQKQGASSS